MCVSEIEKKRKTGTLHKVLHKKFTAKFHGQLFLNVLHIIDQSVYFSLVSFLYNTIEFYYLRKTVT